MQNCICLDRANHKTIDIINRCAAVAQWNRLHLPFCRPGSNPIHTVYAFIKLYLNCNM